MSSDDPNNKLTNGEADNTTQPTITAVFRLLSEVRDRQTRLESRFEALESRLDRDFAAIDTRFAELSEEMKMGLLQLSDKLCDRIDLIRLHTDAGYEDLARRLRKLESKAS